jgi:RNA polymerase sigma-70 factor (ECF subfamily)
VGDRAVVEVAIERAQLGEARGFETLFRTFGAQVVGYLPARHVDDPDGVANEVFLRVFRTIQTFQGDEGRFRSWLFTIVHHVAVDEVRRRRRRVIETPLERGPEPARGDVEKDALDELARARVDELLAGLSSDQREVLLLQILADLSVDQTAAVVGKSNEAVKALTRRGLASLRRAISQSEAVPGSVPPALTRAR